MTLSAESTEPAVPYAFSNDHPAARLRHDHLSGTFDEITFARLAGLGDLAGLRCLEIGAGGGSVARWLVDKVGPTGRVLATDVNTSRLPTGQGYAVLCHNVAAEPVPDGPWDLIHTRMVLLHVPERREVLRRLVAALAPGGWVVVEDAMTSLFRGAVLASPDPDGGRLYERYQSTMVGTILPAKGNDPDWAGKVHGAMLDEGLSDVDTLVQGRSWPGGSAGTAQILVNTAELRHEFLAAGIPAAELDRLRELATDPRFVLRGLLMHSTVGRRPA
jgi:SAM-dependent methyltransferase